MSERTYEQLRDELLAAAEHGQFPTEAQMRELLSFAIKEVEDLIGGMLEDTAHHLGHGDDRFAVIESLINRILDTDTNAAVVAAVLIARLADLRNAGVDVGFVSDHGVTVANV